MYLKSPYPDLPEVPDANVYYTHFKRPDQAEWPDFTAFIDATTGQRRRYSEYVKRVEDLATALGMSVSEGGLGLRAGEAELVGIFSENCMVRWKITCPNFHEPLSFFRIISLLSTHASS